MPPPANGPDARLTGIAEVETLIPETDGGPARAGKASSRDRAVPSRRCIATMEGRPQSRMIRFVLAPGGVVTPDLAARLPGRGAWVSSNREAVETAAKKGAFSRAFKTQARTPADLGSLVEKLLASRTLDQLGLARRAGDLTLGFEQVREAIRAARPACLIEALDGAEDGRGKLLGLLRGMYGGPLGRPPSGPPSRPPSRPPSGPPIGPPSGPQSGSPEGDQAGQDERPESQGLPPVIGCFSADELGMALGRGRVIHACLKQGRFAHVWIGELMRLSGFRRVWLQDWPSSGAHLGASQAGDK